MAELLLENECIIEKRISERIFQPLHVAVRKGNPRIVEKLLDVGANPNVRAERGRTPLHYALEQLILPGTSRMKMSITSSLLNRGADVTIGDDDDVKPLHLAALRKDYEERRKDVAKVLEDACWIVDNLLNYGADINCTSSLPERKNYTTLHFAAAEKGFAPLVEHLIKKGANVNALSEYNFTPLYLATKIGDVDIMKELLDSGADVNIADVKGTTILQIALVTGSPKVVELILQAHPDVDNENNKKCVKTAIKGSAGGLFLEALRPWIVDSDKNVIAEEYKVILKDLFDYGFGLEPEDANDSELLNDASAAGCVKVVQELLRFPRGVDKDMLHIAARNNQEEMVKVLLSHGADVSVADQFGNLPIYYAIRQNNVAITRLLLPTKTKLKVDAHLLNTAVAVGNKEIVDILLEQDPNVDVNASAKEGLTALHCTALEKREYLDGRHRFKDYEEVIFAKLEIARVLLSKGARPGIRCTNGRTALDIASSHGRTKLVALLLENGADVNELNKWGQSPLHQAVYNRAWEVSDVLLKFGANVECKDPRGRTPLHVASKKGYVDLVKILLERGADINAIFEENGQSAPSYAEMARNLLVPSDSMIANYDQIMDMFIWHIVKMIATDKDVSEKNLQWIGEAYTDEGSEDFFTRCRRECERMRIEKIGNSNVSFYDVYTKDLNHLTMYARNESIVSAFGSNNDEKKFPIYWRYIESQFDRGKEREEAWSLGFKAAKYLFECALPEVVIRHMLSYMSIDDLTKLAQVLPDATGRSNCAS